MRKILLILAAIPLILSACREDPIPVPGPDHGPDPAGEKDTSTEPAEWTSAYDYFMYGIGRITITTDDGAAVDSKDTEDYRKCDIKVDGGGVFPDYSGRGKIRGRGNSSWNWYPKKPYRIKLDDGSDFMGMDSNKDWVLLADYRDVTHMMNNVGFTLAKYLGIPYTNHSRYATLTLNGEDMGLYMVTEQVEEGLHRVQLNKDTGILLALDINDGPSDVPNASNNFYSSVFYMASAVKYPEDATRAQTSEVSDAFSELEMAIFTLDWDAIQELLDVQSMVDYLMVQEIIANVETDNNPSTRSVFMNRYHEGSKWIMGPLWDCDGGFDYNWGDMYDYRGWGHTFFEDYRLLIFGSDPFNHEGAYGAGVGDFFANLWGIPEFVALFKKTWNDKREGMFSFLMENLEKTEALIASAAQRDMNLWGISNYTHAAEYSKLCSWLRNRFNYLNRVINAYPADPINGPGPGPVAIDAKTVGSVELETSFAQDGHHFGADVSLSGDQKSRIAYLLGIGSYADVGTLYADGSMIYAAVEPDGSFNGEFTTSAIGFWFNPDGAVTRYGDNSFVYVDFDPAAGVFTVGKHPSICSPGTYTVKQALIYNGKAVEMKIAVNVTD